MRHYYYNAGINWKHGDEKKNRSKERFWPCIAWDSDTAAPAPLVPLGSRPFLGYFNPVQFLTLAGHVTREVHVDWGWEHLSSDELERDKREVKKDI